MSNDPLPPALDLGRGTPRSEPEFVPAWLRQTPGEHRWPAAIAILAAVALQLTLPGELAPRPQYFLPVVELLLFVFLVIGNPVRFSRDWKILRYASITLVAVASVATAWSAVLLIERLVTDNKIRPLDLLLWGGAIWLTNVIVFALWFWEMDRGGPVSRARADKVRPDFLFTPMTVPEMVHPDWEPGFVDYLYLSFTNATAFSPTDTLPLSRWAKLLMMAESAISLIAVALIVARAVNVLGS